MLLRIIPIIGLFKAVDLSSFEDFFGHGVDSVNRNLTLVVGAESTTSTFLGVWYEYGFISFLLFMVFSLRLCIDIRNPVSFVFWFMLVFMLGLNTQIPWLAIMLLYVTKYYSKQKVQRI